MKSRTTSKRIPRALRSALFAALSLSAVLPSLSAVARDYASCQEEVQQYCGKLYASGDHCEPYFSESLIPSIAQDVGRIRMNREAIKEAAEITGEPAENIAAVLLIMHLRTRDNRNTPISYAGELDSGRGQLGSGRGELGSGQGELGSGRGELGSGQGELGSGRGELGSGQGELGSGRGELGSGQGTIEDADSPAIDRSELFPAGSLLASFYNSDLRVCGMNEPTAVACSGVENIARLDHNGFLDAELQLAKIQRREAMSASDARAAVLASDRNSILYAAAYLNRAREAMRAEGVEELYDLPVAVTLYNHQDPQSTAKKIKAKGSAQPNSSGLWAYCHQDLIREILGE